MSIIAHRVSYERNAFHGACSHGIFASGAVVLLVAFVEVGVHQLFQCVEDVNRLAFPYELML
jgi:hypothetical protein